VRCSLQITLIGGNSQTLMATEPPARPALPFTESMPTRGAGVRVVIDDLINLILRPQLAARAPMSGLPTSLTPLALAARHLLGLRASLRPPLRPRLRRIPRRRSRTRPRVLPRLVLQPPQPILMLFNPARQIENELDTRLTS
jgi:hypothetical protein